MPHDAKLDSGNPNPSASEAGRGQIVGNRDSGEQPESGFEEARFIPMQDFGMPYGHDINHSNESTFMPEPLFGLHPNDTGPSNGNGSGFMMPPNNCDGFMPMPKYGLNDIDPSNMPISPEGYIQRVTSLSLKDSSPLVSGNGPSVSSGFANCESIASSILPCCLISCFSQWI